MYVLVVQGKILNVFQSVLRSVAFNHCVPFSRDLVIMYIYDNNTNNTVFIHESRANLFQALKKRNIKIPQDNNYLHKITLIL